ncbi:MAG: host attachment protein [Burkholderiaceae bacterium]|nr:host attachment protein [Burkholderiaceae bacterium]MDZ4145043.1 host attachment protein [Burkholderiales bacterium]
MKKPLWIVVANASLARCFERSSSAEPLTALATLEHPESRLHARDLATDRPGRTHKDDAGRTAYSPRTEPKDREREQFAREVAKFLAEGVEAHRCSGVVLFASNPFLGELLAQLGDGVRRQLVASHPLDLTGLPLQELDQSVRRALFP